MIYLKFLQEKKITKTDISRREAPDYLIKAITKELQEIDSYFKKNNQNNVDLSKLKDLFPQIDTQIEIEKKDQKINYTLELSESKLDFNEENFQEKLSSVYQELSDIQKDIAKKENISEKTCSHFKCCDCCIHTPPMVTALEYQYIKANVDTEKYKSKAQNNQKLHKAEFGTELEITDQKTQNKEAINPNFFSHPCPFLDDNNSCSIYEFRPFACRFYGLSTLDGVSVQACNYFLEQYRLNQTDSRTVLDSRYATSLLAKANSKLAKKLDMPQIQPAGTLSAWLTSVVSI